MSYPARGHASAGIDGKANAAGRRRDACGLCGRVVEVSA